MNHSNPYFELSDEELVLRSQKGENEAYSTLVSRHQSAASGVAYAVCGDFGASEDATQEAFISAWKSLANIRDTSCFRSWVCGIAKNTALNLIRKEKRRDEIVSENPIQSSDSAAPPSEVAATEEEAALLWKTLKTLPENYREPLILFYREQESVASVASALGISEESVRQRLSRGRKMLRDRISSKITFTLQKTAPSSAFTLSVMGALPPVGVGLGVAASATTAKAASAGSAGVAKSGSALFGAGVAGTFVSGAIGFFGLYVLRRYLKAIKMPEKVRKQWIQLFLAELAMSIVFMLFVVGFALTDGYPFGAIAISPAFLLTASIVVYMTATVGLVAYAYKQLNPADLNQQLSQYTFNRYKSKLSLAGIPLISIALGPDAARSEYEGRARGWIAIGDNAYGLCAIGGKAVGLLAIGGMCLGLVSIGGISVGVISLSAVAFGLIAIGGLAVGWDIALGGTAVSQNVSLGGLSVSSNQAAGGLPIAPSIQNWETLSSQHSWLDSLIQMGPSLAWLSVLFVPVMIYALRTIKKLESQR